MRTPRGDPRRPASGPEAVPSDVPGAIGFGLLPPPDVSGDGPDWTYRERLEHFRSRGLVVKMTSCRGGQLFMLTDNDRAVENGAVFVAEGILDFHGVVCNKRPSARDARELAGEQESGAFAWGRFCFRGDPETLALFRQALTARGPVSDGTPDLSYDQVLARLRAQRLVVKMRLFRRDGYEGCLFVFTDREGDADRAQQLVEQGETADRNKNPHLLRNTVLCEKAQFAFLARKEVEGFGPSARGSAWGRFAFLALGPDGDPAPRLEEIRRALTVP